MPSLFVFAEIYSLFSDLVELFVSVLVSVFLLSDFFSRDPLPDGDL